MEQSTEEIFSQIKDKMLLREVEQTAEIIRQKRGIDLVELSKEEKQKQEEEIKSLLVNY